ncbi:MAG: OmpA family protein [Loktanella sp.]|nr:OmpA family protein [Loktanella sp.]
MRLSALFIRLGAFLIAALVSVVAARATVAVVEDRSVIAVQEELVEMGQDWAEVQGDGLQVIIEGEAPSEVDRYRAISAAGRLVDASRVIDSMAVVASEGIAPPQFAIEILRNDKGVSLIGLIPASTDRDALLERVGEAAGGATVTDLLDAGDYPVPDSWRSAVDYAIRAVGELERSKISVASDRVVVTAISDSNRQKTQLETRLNRSRPADVRVSLNITAPRPVISPFLTRFTLDEEGPRFSACAVGSLEANQVVISAAQEVGFEGRSPCVEALGSPSRQWADTIAMGIRAVGELGGGTLTISNTDVSLVALPGTAQDAFEAVVGELENDLPAAFALTAELPVNEDADGDGPPTFTATLSPEGAAQLRGRVNDDLTNMAVENFAMAKFGANDLTMGTRIVDGLPTGWPVRVLAGIDALSRLSNGSVTVTPDRITIRGNTGNASASADITGLMVEKLGQSAAVSIDVTYVEELDPVAGLPTAEECLAQIDVVTEDRKITFEPGSTTISSEASPIMDDIADILQGCPDLPIQIAGYTDSQGGEEMNQQLSKDRAESVLAALRSRRVPVSTFDAEGFGEADPIESNETAEGREANRRIEFSLIVPESDADAESALDETAEEGETPDAPESE